MSLKMWKHQFLAVTILLLVCTTVMMAQVKTTTTQIPGTPTTAVEVERGEVVYVVGNDLVVKMENGEIRHFTVPDNATATVDGKQVTLADLKPGMKLQRTITSTSQVDTVQTIKTGTGIVTNVIPPLSVTLRFEDNSVQQFKIPKDQVFMVDGQKKTAFELKKGMKVTATRVVLEPKTVASTSRQTAGSAPKPSAPPLEGTLLIAELPPPKPVTEPISRTITAPEPSGAPEPPPAKLPSTGSLVPLIGLLGLLFSGTSLAIRLLRRS